MFGFDLQAVEDPLGPAAAPVRAETAALVGRMTVPPGPQRTGAIDRLIGALVAAGLWDRLDVLIVLAAHDAQAALLNWKGPGSATPGGGPVFVPDRGFFCDGLDDWIDTGFAPAAGVRFQQNDAMMGAWFRKGGRNANSPVGTVSSTAATINPRSASDASASRLNGTAAVGGGAVASGYGWTAVDRSGSTLRQYAGGVLLGTATSSSAARSSATIGLGRAAGNYADGQFCAFAAGASLDAAGHAALFAALGTYMDAVGVAALPQPGSRTLALASAFALPDGSAPVAAGERMGATGLVRRPDGRWYVGNGVAARRALLFSRMSADFSNVEAEFTATGLGLGPNGAGSVQGMTLDGSDGTIWFIAKLSGADGATTLLHHFDPATETMIGQPVPIIAADTGVAYDPAIDRLWVTRDLGATGALVLYSKAGAPLSAPIPTPGDTDQCFVVSAAAGGFQAGDLLVTSGANGAAGAISVFHRLDYGGMALRRVDTLAGADAIEGVAVSDGWCFVVNDAATHPGSPRLNRVLRYPA